MRFNDFKEMYSTLKEEIYENNKKGFTMSQDYDLWLNEQRSNKILILDYILEDSAVKECGDNTITKLRYCYRIQNYTTKELDTYELQGEAAGW